MELNEVWLETVLKRATQERSVARVISVEKEDVVNKGDNYASDIFRLKMETVLGSGRTATRSVIMKKMPVTEHRAKQLGEWGFFRKEIKMYNTVLPEMEKLLESVGDAREPLWGQCLYTRPDDLLILEDLKELGYRMADKMLGLDMEHATLVIRSIGKYHAMSAVLAETGKLDSADFQSNIFSTKKEQMGMYVDQILRTLADVIDTTWTPEWKVCSTRIRSLVGKAVDIIGEQFDSKGNKFNVLNHGDSWINNLMFKYNIKNDAPTSMRFVDFQLGYYTSYAYDLQCMLSSSVRPEIRDEDYGCLLSEYHASLTEHLAMFGFAGDNAPSLEEVKEEFKKKSVLGLVLAIMLLPLVLAEPEEVPDIEELLKEFDKTNQVKVDPRPMLGKRFTAMVKSVLNFCQRSGVFD